MSLTNPSIGELLDRLSILKWKIHYGEEAGKDVTHFRVEQHEIMDRLPADLDLAAEPVARLFQVNRMLWVDTDCLRNAIRVSWVMGQSDLGVEILQLNDERARLIQQINADHGDYRIEKL